MRSPWAYAKVYAIYGIGGLFFFTYVYCEAAWQRVWCLMWSSKS